MTVPENHRLIAVLSVLVLASLNLVIQASEFDAADSQSVSTSTEIERTKRLIEGARGLREKYHQDPQRPQYHFMAPEAVYGSFDPNGALYWKGKYHLFYILYLPGLTYLEGKICWGHASSIDLLHWRHHPTAIQPLPGDPDQDIYSGEAFLDKAGIPTVIYNSPAGACIATSQEDDLIRWKKSPHNPVIGPPQKRGNDPGIWIEGDTYYVMKGSCIDGDTAFLFKSSNLTNWKLLGRFYESSREWTRTDEDCACPTFFNLGNKRMLLFTSHYGGAQYYLGRFENEKFYPEQHARMNWPGGPFFAPESMLDPQGRRILWAWVCETRSREQIFASGWAGVMSLPRILSLAQDGTVQIEPAKELENLRYDPVHRQDIRLTADNEILLENIKGDSLELKIQFENSEAQQVGVKVRCAPDGSEQTTIYYDRTSERLVIDTTQSTLSAGIVQPFPFPFAAMHEEPLKNSRNVQLQQAPFSLQPGEPLQLRIFLDRSILEVFANNRQCVTQRIYPSRPDSHRVALFSRGGSAKVESIIAWKMAATNAW